MLHRRHSIYLFFDSFFGDRWHASLVEDEDGTCLGVISRTLLQRTELAALRARGSNDLLGEKEALIMLTDMMEPWR